MTATNGPYVHGAASNELLLRGSSRCSAWVNFFEGVFSDACPIKTGDTQHAHLVVVEKEEQRTPYVQLLVAHEVILTEGQLQNALVDD